MEESRKKELYDKLQRLSEMASDICGGLYDFNDLFYEQGEVYNALSNMALDASELASKLNDNTILGDTITCKLEGEDKEIAIDDLIGFIRLNGKICYGGVTKITPGNGTSDVILSIVDTDDPKDVGNFSMRKVMSWHSWCYLNRKGWNKVVDSLVSQKKSVSLSVQNDAFNIMVSDKSSGAVLQKNGLYLKDFNESLFNEMKGV